jgi:CAAX protease family protein
LTAQAASRALRGFNHDGEPASPARAALTGFLSRPDSFGNARALRVDFLRFVVIAITITLAIESSSQVLEMLGAGTRLRPLMIIASEFGPTFSAIIAIRLRGGACATGRLMRKLRPGGVSLRWLAGVTVAPLVLYGGARAAAAMLGASGLQSSAQLAVRWTPQSDLFAAGFFLAGAVGEELGWRGYALPSLQSAHGALSASLMIGAAWAVWHLPGFLFSGIAEGGIRFHWFVLEVVALSVIFTVVVNSSGPSVVTAVVLHAALNFGSGFYRIPPAMAGTQVPYLASVAIIFAVAISLIGMLGPRTLSTRQTQIRFD